MRIAIPLTFNQVYIVGKERGEDRNPINLQSSLYCGEEKGEDRDPINLQSSLYCGGERGEDRDPINLQSSLYCGEEKREDRDPINCCGEERGEDRDPINRTNSVTRFVPVPSHELDFQRHMSCLFVFLYKYRDVFNFCLESQSLFPRQSIPST